MDGEKIRRVLEEVARGVLDPAEAFRRLRYLPFEDLGFARVDHHRALRHGAPEAVFSPGKRPEQVVSIVRRLAEGHDNVLVTRADEATIRAIAASGLPHRVHDAARLVIVRPVEVEQAGLVTVLSAGTADQPVAEEAAVTAEVLGSRVERVYDCGVAGLHRLLPHLPRLAEAHALVVVAGMEGALPSVVGGLVDRPVVAVPTSVGYGASLGGVAALLAMLNSCAPGVAVVNIDNGYGAGVLASRISRMAAIASPGPGERVDDASAGVRPAAAP